MKPLILKPWIYVTFLLACERDSNDVTVSSTEWTICVFHPGSSLGCSLGWLGIPHAHIGLFFSSDSKLCWFMLNYKRWTKNAHNSAQTSRLISLNAQFYAPRKPISSCTALRFFHFRFKQCIVFGIVNSHTLVIEHNQRIINIEMLTQTNHWLNWW